MDKPALTQPTYPFITMDPISLLRRQDISDLTPEEEAALMRELSAAYQMDEAAAVSHEVQRTADKVRGRLLANRDAGPADPPPMP
jgi:hypothetical protein